MKGNRCHEKMNSALELPQDPSNKTSTTVPNQIITLKFRKYSMKISNKHTRKTKHYCPNTFLTNVPILKSMKILAWNELITDFEQTFPRHITETKYGLANIPVCCTTHLMAAISNTHGARDVIWIPTN